MAFELSPFTGLALPVESTCCLCVSGNQYQYALCLQIQDLSVLAADPTPKSVNRPWLKLASSQFVGDHKLPALRTVWLLSSC